MTVDSISLGTEHVIVIRDALQIIIEVNSILSASRGALGLIFEKIEWVLSLGAIGSDVVIHVQKF
jgi:hypothetical protein